MTCAQCLDITCASSGRGHLVFGDAEGVITLVDRDFRLYPFQVRHQNNSMLQLCFVLAMPLLSLTHTVGCRPSSTMSTM